MSQLSLCKKEESKGLPRMTVLKFLSISAVLHAFHNQSQQNALLNINYTFFLKAVVLKPFQ